MKYTARPLTPDLWPQLEELFGTVGACNGCWCMYWRIGSAYTKRPRDENRKAFRAVVKKGPPPGILLFADDLAVGWAQITPRTDLPKLQTARYTKPLDDNPMWSVSCFFVRKGWRGKGVMTALIAEAAKFAKKMKAPTLEAYPIDTASGKRGNAMLYTGTRSAFEKAGFAVTADRGNRHVTMRLDLKKAKAA
jgi:GNAT superfamily N-acetyltransferase